MGRCEYGLNANRTKTLLLALRRRKTRTPNLACIAFCGPLVSHFFKSRFHVRRHAGAVFCTKDMTSMVRTEAVGSFIGLTLRNICFLPPHFCTNYYISQSRYYSLLLAWLSFYLVGVSCVHCLHPILTDAGRCGHKQFSALHAQQPP
jgi:hypothetical protein